MIEFKAAKFVETPDGDLIDPTRIDSLRHWPPIGGPYSQDHRTQLHTIDGGLWELYRGPSEEKAIAVRDEMKAKIRAALEPPMPIAVGQ